MMPSHVPLKLQTSHFRIDARFVRKPLEFLVFARRYRINLRIERLLIPRAVAEPKIIFSRKALSDVAGHLLVLSPYTGRSDRPVAVNKAGAHG